MNKPNQLTRNEIESIQKKIKWEVIFLMFLMFILGIIGTIWYISMTPAPVLTCPPSDNVLGIYTNNSFDFKGEWIHLNVNSMNYSQCVSTASHECGHEYFARLCQTNDATCKQIEDYLAANQ